MKYALSPVSRRDIKAIFGLNKELIDRYENVTEINYAKVMKIIRNGIKERIGEYKKIVCGGETAGYLLISERADCAELEDLFLYPDFQNKGIGTAIVKDIIANTQKPVFLYVFVKNDGAVRLYRRLGFEIAETVGKTRYKMIREVKLDV